MLRAVSSISFESPVLEILVSARRDVYRLIRIKKFSTAAAATQMVMAGEPRRAEASGAPPLSPPPPSPPPPPPRRAWPVAAALAVTASLGGVYFYRKMTDEEPRPEPLAEAEPATPAAPEPYPAAPELLPEHVDFLLVGGGTASFAAMRAIRAARPDATVLLVGDEPLPPYMRPPLSKELWREPALEAAAADPAALPALSFRQWNGKRRPLLYEPLAFYAPVERLREGGGAAAARGWRVARLAVERREAELRAPGREPRTLTYGRCLVAPGVRPRRLEALRAAREAGRAVTVRGAEDAARLARLLAEPGVRDVLLVGGGFLATELAAALAERLAPEGKRVTQAYRGAAPLERVLPPYLAREAARRLAAAGVRQLAGTEITGAEPAAAGGALRVRLRGGGELRADVVVECVGAEPDAAAARAWGLEVAADGGVAASAELQARAGVWAAGDALSWHDAALGLRRRLEHHDHAVASGRRAGENMAAPDGAPQRPYTHRPMFWSDLGPDLGYEAIGEVDSRLSTVGVFCAADVEQAAAPAAEPERRYERGVVFYTREGRVVGVLLWNLFNRMHVARQVLASGQFDDLFEAAKLFALHEDD